MWPNRELLDLIGIDLPIIQAPMAGANRSAMAIAVSEAGGLGSLPCAMLDAAMARAEIGVIRQQTAKPVNVNFFCHKPAAPDPDRDAAWKRHLAAYYEELRLDASASAPAVNRAHAGRSANDGWQLVSLRVSSKAEYYCMKTIVSLFIT